MLRRSVRKAAQHLLFPPVLGAALPRPRRDRARVFWGIPRGRVGGHNVRTRRMIGAFGNHLVSPNLVYAQSAWNAAALRGAQAFGRSGRGPLVFNQNGWYFPAWFNGDCRAANARLVATQRVADYVIFQSRFCLEAGIALTGYCPPNYEILHNGVPAVADPVEYRGDGKSCWLAAVFTPDYEHVLRPTLMAFDLLRRRLPRNRVPRLRLAGQLHPLTVRAAWFIELKRLLASLEADGICEWLGTYRMDQLPSLMAGTDVALHLKYKDPCPNAVIERMRHGVPHVFSASGGTPELVGDAGLPIAVADQWDEAVAVEVEALAETVTTALNQATALRRRVMERRALFDWGAYVDRHREIFADLLAGEPVRGRQS